MMKSAAVRPSHAYMAREKHEEYTADVVVDCCEKLGDGGWS